MVRGLRTIGDLAPGTPALEEPAAAPRADGPAWAIAALVVGTVIAVDPAGLVPTGPLRWTVITVTTGRRDRDARLGAPVTLPRTHDRAVGGAGRGAPRRDPPRGGSAARVDRHARSSARVPHVADVPALFLAGHACTSRAAGRVIVPRAGRSARSVLGAWSTAEVLGPCAPRAEFADSRAGGPFGQPAYLGAACLLFGPLAIAAALDRGGGECVVAAGAVTGACGAALVALGRVADAGGVGRRRSWPPSRSCSAGARCCAGIAPRASQSCRALGAIAIAVGVTSPAGRPRGVDVRSLRTAPAPAGSTSGGSPHAPSRIIRCSASGPEGYRGVFPQEVDAAYVQAYGVAVYPDRAHNGMLDVTVDRRRARRPALRGVAARRVAARVARTPPDRPARASRSAAP